MLLQKTDCITWHMSSVFQREGTNAKASVYISTLISSVATGFIRCTAGRIAKLQVRVHIPFLQRDTSVSKDFYCSLIKTVQPSKGKQSGVTVGCDALLLGVTLLSGSLQM